MWVSMILRTPNTASVLYLSRCLLGLRISPFVVCLFSLSIFCTLREENVGKCVNYSSDESLPDTNHETGLITNNL
jgi:hypothetical protein